MITPRASILIAATPAEVIGFVADPANAPRWMKALEVSELITPGPIRVGSQFREIQSAGGRRIETVCEVVEFDLVRRYAWRSVGEGPASYGGGFTASSEGGQTALVYEGWATMSGRLAAREAAWALQAQREAEAELAAIKAAIEGTRTGEALRP